LDEAGMTVMARANKGATLSHSAVHQGRAGAAEYLSVEAGLDETACTKDGLIDTIATAAYSGQLEAFVVRLESMWLPCRV